MSSDTATRLAAFKAAEIRILEAQQLGHGDRSKRLAELADVRAAIKDLEAKLAREARIAAGNPSGQTILVAGFNQRLN